MNEFGLRPIKAEDLRADPGLRKEMRRTALLGSHPRRELATIIEKIEEEEKEQK